MIHFVVTPGHHNTLWSIIPRWKIWQAPLAAKKWTYPQLFMARHAPPGVWVMTDLERLAPWELRLAAEIGHIIRAAGPAYRLLNDPCVAASRYELLLRLYEAGFNGFRAWRAEDGSCKPRFPVFLRLESDHGFPIGGLLHNAAELDRALAELKNAAIPRRGVLVIEYQAEPLADGNFRKYAAYRIGDKIVADHMVHEDNWNAKFGSQSAWSPERFHDEEVYVQSNPHKHDLMRAFEIAEIDYGRADYGIVDGQIQIWEINTNPFLPAGKVKAAQPLRRTATKVSKANRIAALKSLMTTAPGRPVALQSEFLDIHRRRQRLPQRDIIRP